MEKGYFQMGNEIYAAIKAGNIQATDFYLALLSNTNTGWMKELYNYFLEHKKLS